MWEGGRVPDRFQCSQSSSALPSTYVCRVSARMVPASVCHGEARRAVTSQSSRSSGGVPAGRRRTASSVPRPNMAQPPCSLLVMDSG